MLEVKLVYNTGDEIINVPQSWDDMTFEQYVDLVNRDELDDHGRVDWLKRASIITGISEGNLKQCSQETITMIFGCLMFMADINPLTSSPIPDEFKNWEYKSLSYGSSCDIDDALLDNLDELKKKLGRDPEEKELQAHRINCGAKIVEIITRKKVGDNWIGLDILKDPVTKVLGLVNFFLLKLESSDPIGKY